MKIYNPTGFSSNLTGSFTGSFKGEFDGIFSEETSNNISGAFEEVSSSLSARISSNESNVSSLNSSTSSYLLNSTDTLDGDLTVTGTITAQEFHTEFVSSSIIYESGSTKFGDTSDDIHSFSGSLRVKGSGDHYFTDGNVGIGTTSPGSYDTAIIGSGHKFLNVQASSTNYAVQTLAGDSGTNGNRLGYLTFVNDNNNATHKYSAWIGSEVEGTTANKQGGRLIFSTTSDNSTAGPIERMRITSDGNVGIGTASPATKLHIQSGNISTNFTEVIKLSNTVGVGGGSSVFFKTSGADSAGRYGVKLGAVRSDSDNGSSVFKIQQELDNGSGTVLGLLDTFTINQYGNVGIGTTSPTSNLHVYSTGNGVIQTERASGALVFMRAQSTTGVIGTTSNHRLDLSTNGGVRATITSGGNVGIGTTSPGEKLEVNGNIRLGNSPSLLWGSNNLTLKTASSSTIGVFSLAPNSDGTVYAPRFQMLNASSVVGVSIRTDANSYFNGGNVGIGTTNPNKKLEVNGSFKLGTNAYIEYGAGYPYTITTANTAAVGNLVFSAGLGSAAFESRIDLQGTNTAGAAGITLSTAATTRMVVTSDGNVGIGTTSPGSKLEVDGNIIINAGYQAERKGLQINTNLGNDNRSAGVGVIRINPISGDWVNSYTFTTGGSSGGIFSNPSFGLRHTFGGVGSSLAEVNTDLMVTSTATGVPYSVIRLMGQTGNVGIGTTNPTQKLHLHNGTLLIDSDAGISTGIWMPDVNGNPSLRIVTDQAAGSHSSIVNAWGNASNAGVMVGSTRNDGFAFQVRSGVTLTDGFANDVGNTRMVVLGNGNVGIGTTSPAYTLDVNGGFHSSNITIADGIYHEGDTNNYFQFATDTQIFATAGSERMRITSAGRVGIGTTNPAQLLHVESASTNARALIKTTGTGNITAGVQIVCNDSDLFFGAADDGYTAVPEYTGKAFLQGNGGDFAIVNMTDDLEFYAGGRTSADKHMVVTGAGNVGIGNAPVDTYTGYKLQVGSSSELQTFISIGNSTTGVGPLNGLVIGNDSTGAHIVQREAAPLRIYTTDTERMRITSSGNVGIGLTNPADKLHVDGTSQFNGTVQITDDATFETFIKAPNMQNYANNNDAILGGLTAGTLYHTNGTIKIVI